MKFASAVVLFSAAILGANAVDWQSVKPLERTVKVPMEHYAEVPNGRITNGQIAERTQFPYQVGLLLFAYHIRWCGGTLISDMWIVTAAHCTDNLQNGIDVYLGSWNIFDSKEMGRQIIFVPNNGVIRHEEYDSTTLLHDIALIKMPQQVWFNEYIWPAKLPAKLNNPNDYFNEDSIASGWGRSSDSITADILTSPLRYIELPIIGNVPCKVWHGASLAWSNICIKSIDGASTCNGDSGGPLVLANGNQTLVGIASFSGPLFCEQGWPAVFTRITSYLDWIKEHSGVVGY